MIVGLKGALDIISATYNSWSMSV